MPPPLSLLPRCFPLCLTPLFLCPVTVRGDFCFWPRDETEWGRHRRRLNQHRVCTGVIKRTRRVQVALLQQKTSTITHLSLFLCRNCWKKEVVKEREQVFISKALFICCQMLCCYKELQKKGCKGFVVGLLSVEKVPHIPSPIPSLSGCLWSKYSFRILIYTCLAVLPTSVSPL